MLVNLKNLKPGPKALMDLLCGYFPQMKPDMYVAPANHDSGGLALSEGLALKLVWPLGAPKDQELGETLLRLLIEAADDYGLRVVVFDRLIWTRRTRQVSDLARSVSHTHTLFVEFLTISVGQTDFSKLEARLKALWLQDETAAENSDGPTVRELQLPEPQIPAAEVVVSSDGPTVRELQLPDEHPAISSAG